MKPVRHLALPVRPELLAIAAPLARGDGVTQTALPSLSVIRSAQPTTLRHGVLEPSFCLVLQGGKSIQLGAEAHAYGEGCYVVSVVDLPTSGRITRASRSEPYVGLRVGLAAATVAAVAIEAQLEQKLAAAPVGPAAFVGRSDDGIQDCLLRLLRLVHLPDEAAFLESSVLRELIFRLLRSPHGHLIHRTIVQEQRDQAVTRAIGWLKVHFAEPMKIEALARASSMSVSSLHHKFKAATAMGPLQYQKQLRLQEARRLLLGGLDAGTAAFQVGYESQSQFTREYRRLFGAPPLQDVRALRGRTEVDDLATPRTSP